MPCNARLTGLILLVLSTLCFPAVVPLPLPSPGAPAAAAPAHRKVLLLAGRPSHGFGAHDHFAGMTLIARWLNENTPDIAASVHRNGWPADAAALDDAAAIVMYCDGDTGHPALRHLEQLDALAAKGVGIGMIHFALEVPRDRAGDRFLRWIGGYFEVNWSVNPHWRAEFPSIPDHEVTRGVKPFATADEWYFHMRFPPEMRNVTPILSAVPPDRLRSQPDGPRSSNAAIRAEIGKNTPEHLMWVYERENNGRGFGFTGGHFHWNWAQDDQRKVVLNAIAWIAHARIPPGGITSPRPTLDDLLANPDEPIPPSFSRARRQADLDTLNGPPTTQPVSTPQ